MKNINMKKVVAGVAALGLSAMFAGAVVAANVTDATWKAPNALTKADLFTNGVPAYNIVIGSMAMPIDVVWAGNIAAAIGQKAYTTSTTTGGATLGDVVVEVGSEGTTSISGDGYLADNYTINKMNNVAKVLDNQDYSLLYKKDISADSDHAGASTLTTYDELSVTANVYFNKDKDVKDIVAAIDKGAIVYSVDFDEGIKDDYTDAGASPRFKFNLMGKNYTIDSFDGTTLKLIQNIATQTYKAGDTISADTYTVEVVAIKDTGANTNRYEVEMNLKDSAGVIKANDVFRSGDTKIFDEYLTTTLDIDTVYSDSVKIITGSSGKLELKNGSKITDFPEKGDKLWKSTFTYTAPYLTKIALATDDSSQRYTNDNALKVDDKVTLPLGFGEIQFLGLTTEKSTEFTLKDNALTFVDADRKDHTLFLYDLDEATTARDSYTTQEIDGHPLYIKFYANGTNVTDANYTVQLDDSDGKYLADGAISGTAATWGTTPVYYTAAGTVVNATTVGMMYGMEVPLYNNEDKLVDYKFIATPVSASLYTTVKTIAFGLAKTQTAALGIGDTTYTWDVTGVDSTNAAAGFFTDAAFIGDRADSATQALNYAKDSFESIAEIDVANATDTHIYSYIDAYTGDMVNLSDNDFLGTYKQVAYTDRTNTFDLSDEGNDTDLEFGYTTYGAYVSIKDGYVNMTLPEQALKGQIFIGGGVSSETTLNGGEVTLTGTGTVVKTTDGKISVKLVSGAVNGGTSGTTITPAAWNVGTNRLVYLDNESPAGAMIIVGGFVVNNLAKTTYGLEDKLVQSGNYVVGQASNGNIIVAGTDAVDTASAAKELIAAIENM